MIYRPICPKCGKDLITIYYAEEFHYSKVYVDDKTKEFDRIETDYVENGDSDDVRMQCESCGTKYPRVYDYYDSFPEYFRLEKPEEEEEEFEE